MKCEHDREVGGTSQLDGVAWCGGVGTCTCCRQIFGYLHSGSYGAEGVIRSSTQDETLCKPCGGKTIQYIHPDYEEVEVGPRHFHFRRKAKT